MSLRLHVRGSTVKTMLLRLLSPPVPQYTVLFSVPDALVGANATYYNGTLCNEQDPSQHTQPAFTNTICTVITGGRRPFGFVANLTEDTYPHMPLLPPRDQRQATPAVLSSFTCDSGVDPATGRTSRCSAANASYPLPSEQSPECKWSGISNSLLFCTGPFGRRPGNKEVLGRLGDANGPSDRTRLLLSEKPVLMIMRCWARHDPLHDLIPIFNAFVHPSMIACCRLRRERVRAAPGCRTAGGRRGAGPQRGAAGGAV